MLVLRGEISRLIITVPPRSLKSICAFTSDYALLIEDKGSGMSLIQDLKTEHIHAVAVHPKEDKVIRMNAQTARIEAGSVLLPRRAHWLDDFFQEVLAFPASRHTDQIDALSQALNHAFNRRPPAFVVGLSSEVFHDLISRSDRRVRHLRTAGAISKWPDRGEIGTRRA